MIRDKILSKLIPAMGAQLSDATEDYVFTRTTDGTFDPIQNSYVPGVEEEVSGKGIYLSFSLYEQQANEIAHGDVKFIIPSTYERPPIGSVVTVKGEQYHVIDYLNSPANVIYTAQLRRIG